MAKKISTFYGIQIQITPFTGIRHWSLSWDMWISCKTWYPVPLIRKLILSSNVCLNFLFNQILSRSVYERTVCFVLSVTEDGWISLNASVSETLCVYCSKCRRAIAKNKLFLPPDFTTKMLHHFSFLPCELHFPPIPSSLICWF